MRLAVVIVALGAIAVTLVHVRRGQMVARHELQQIRSEEVLVRRRLWDQQVRLGELTTPTDVRERVAAILEAPDDTDHLARGQEP